MTCPRAQCVSIAVFLAGGQGCATGCTLHPCDGGDGESARCHGCSTCILTYSFDCPHFFLLHLREVGTGSWLSVSVTSVFGRGESSGTYSGDIGMLVPSCFSALPHCPSLPSLLPLASSFHPPPCHSVPSLISPHLSPFSSNVHPGFIFLIIFYIFLLQMTYRIMLVSGVYPSD